MNARRESTLQKRPSHGKKVLGGIRPSHWTNMQNTLGYDSTPRIEKKCSGENILGLGGIVVQLKRGNYATISGEFTT